MFDVPGVDYRRFGEAQWLSVPSSLTGQVMLQGTGSGSFTLEVQEVNGNTITASTTFAAVPSATSTTASLAISSSTSPTANGTLLVDEDGNGTTDLTVRAVQNSIVLPPSITVLGTSTGSVSVSYANVPSSAQIVFANSAGQLVGGYRTPITGTGTTTILNWGLAAGTYQLKILAGSPRVQLNASSTPYAVSSPLYVATSSSPQLSYVSSDPVAKTVTVTYTYMPTNAEVVFYNATSSLLVVGSNVLIGSGTGTSTISTANIPSGSFYLSARDATTHTPTYVQTSSFSI